jgi:hypothetical protein
MDVKSFPNFTHAARQCWESIPADIRHRLLSNVWCGRCRHETTITNFSGTTKTNDMLLHRRDAQPLSQRHSSFPDEQNLLRR